MTTKDGHPVDGIVHDGNNTTIEPGYLATHTALGKALLEYAQNHPLDKQTAYPENVHMSDANGNAISDSNPVKIDPTTKINNPFTLSNYNGSVSITNLPKDYQIIDDKGNVVTTVESGKQYRVKYVGSSVPSSSTANDVANEVKATANYQTLVDSKYYSAQETANTATNNPFQNMVNLNTKAASFVFPIIFGEKQASSSVKSSSSSSSSSSNVTTSSSVESSNHKAMKNNSSVVSSSKQATGVVVANNNNQNHGSNNGNGTGKGNGTGYGHGLPQTGEQQASVILVAIGAIALAAAGYVALRKRN
nr:LPXTG cell wall anchor domain-containing protein [uncultured Ligilactobacillus sp.]